MGTRDYAKPGLHNVYCQDCKRKRKSNEIKLRWDKLWVCRDCWEPRHPADTFKSRPENRTAKPILATRSNTGLESGNGKYIRSGHFILNSGGYDLVVDPTSPFGRIGHDGDSSGIIQGKVDHDTT